jgi:hypothetical protein
MGSEERLPAGIGMHEIKSTVDDGQPRVVLELP